MKTINLCILLLVLGTTALTAQEFRGAEIGLQVANQADRSALLVLGVREGATTGLDAELQEYELPPQPPNEIFDARIISTPGHSDLGLGGIRDYRAPESTTAPFTMTYTIAWQAGEGSNAVLVTWQVPYEARITSLSIDGEDMAGETQWLSDFAQGQATVRVTFNYQPLEFLATPASITFDVDDRFTLPSENVQLVTKNDPGASWIASCDAPWLSLSPGSGNGDGMLTVAVTNADMPNGNYQTVIRLRSPVYPVQLDIPVALSITVGVENPSAPRTIRLIGNYPNPFTEETAILLQLGSAGQDAATLRIHDALGRMVADLTGQLEARSDAQRIRFHASSLPPGVYTCRLDCGGRALIRSMVLLK
ncbi:MAG: T9SS type A sorting domain-containing protein [Bacteroidetes bacterium]|nr:T9SS type A sorting domain-containing protein [Bacteroidota bacterium]